MACMERLQSHSAASPSHPWSPKLRQRQHSNRPGSRGSRQGMQRTAAAALQPETYGAEKRGLERVSGNYSQGGSDKRGGVGQRDGASSAAAQVPSPPMPSLQPLDLAYIQDVYKESWFYHSGTNPEFVKLNSHILSCLKACKTMKQVQKLVDLELPSMSGITVAQVMLKAAIQMRPKSPEGRRYSLAELLQAAIPPSVSSTSSAQAPADVSSAGVPLAHSTGSSSSSSSSSSNMTSPDGSKGDQEDAALKQSKREWVQLAPALVRRLLVHMVHMPASQVSLPCVAIALQSVGVVTEGRAVLTASEATAVSSLLNHVRADLFVASPQQLAQIAHGLCFAQVAPPLGCLKEFSKVSLSKLSCMNAHQLGLVAHALGRQRYLPDAFWRAHFAAHTAPQLASMQPRELSNTLWVVAQWHVDPGSEWREAACSAVLVKLPALPAACLASVLRSLQTICHSLPLTWMAAVVARLVELAPQTTLRQDCEVLAAFASLTYMPEQGSMAAYVAALQPKLATASTTELAISLKALARLHFLPSREWLGDWVAAARRQVRGFQAEETANTLACFATWRIKPPRDFTLELFELTVAQTNEGTFPPYFATRMLCALATLRLAPPRQMLRQLLQVLGSETLVQQNEAAGMKHSSRMGSIKLAANTGASDSRAPVPNLNLKLMAAALANAFAALPCLLRCYDPQQLASVAAGAGGSVAVVQADEGKGLDPATSSSSSSSRAAVEVGHGGLKGVESQVQGTAERVPAGADGSAAMGGTRPLTRLASTGDGSGTAAAARGSSWSGADASGPVPSASSSAGGGGGSSNRALAEVTAMLLPPSVVGPMLGVLSRRLDRLEGRHLCVLACALVRLQLYPGRGFLMAHVSAVAGQLPRMDSSEKRRLSACYAKLNGH